MCGATYNSGRGRQGWATEPRSDSLQRLQTLNNSFRRSESAVACSMHVSTVLTLDLVCHLVYNKKVFPTFVGVNRWLPLSHFLGDRAPHLCGGKPDGNGLGGTQYQTSPTSVGIKPGVVCALCMVDLIQKAVRCVFLSVWPSSKHAKCALFM